MNKEKQGVLSLTESDSKGESRTLTASPAFIADRALDDSVYARATRDRLGYWEEQAAQLHWFKKWDRVLDWNPPWVRWFDGGKLNASYNCLDRHLEGERSTKPAVIFEAENGDSRTLTYEQLHGEVCKAANLLKSLGVTKGDRVVIFMPMIVETVISMLACARIGAVHCVVFGGFSAEALRERIEDVEAKLVMTTDDGQRRGKIINMKGIAEEALSAGCESVERVIVVRRQPDKEPLGETSNQGRDVDYHEAMKEMSTNCPAEVMDAEDMLFVLYTSGTTGKPKGVVHTTGGYMTGVATTHKGVFDLKENDIYWCTADVGWITGHSYIVYGPLANGATVLLYEGAPDYPAKDRYWEIIAKHKVSILYTAPTAIRTFKKWGLSYLEKHDLSSLRVLGTVGEPINPEVWLWYYKFVGGERCPICDTWWQTETGMIMLSPLAGLSEMKPGSCSAPIPGVKVSVLSRSGEVMEWGHNGYLTVSEPWPAMMRTIYGNDNRYVKSYWSHWPGIYFTGDGARRDKDGFFWIIGRVDDVINVSGHRFSAMEVENALLEHPAVAEAACVGKTHEVKGQALVIFVTLRDKNAPKDEVISDLRQFLVGRIGAFARPDEVYVTNDLPKTRSGKIIRRLLKDIAEGRAMGDTTTMESSHVLKELYKG
ncbi:MAG: acetate--CoA ligase [Peptococcaceae bacterium]|nr:acetate--CoA ligase [Peptococcaceae bacterium]